MLGSILAAFGMCADGVAEGLYARRHGFSARAAGIGYAAGAVVGWLANVVTPITFTVESITVATRTARTRPEILYIVVLSAIPSILLGAFGLYSTFIGLLNPAVIAGAIGGVGIILAGVGVDYVKAKPVLAGASILVGFGAYMLTQDLVIVILLSVGAGTLIHHFFPKSLRQLGQSEGGSEDEDDAAAEDEAELRLIPFDVKRMVTRSVIVGAFSVFALRTGAVVSYDTVNADLAGTDPSLDAATLMAGLGSLASGLLGGSPVETTPAPMAATEHPVLSNTLFMALMAGIALLGLIKRIGTFVPLQAIAGFLVVLGIPVIMPEQLPGAIEEPLAGGTALAITAMTNPFYGIVAGEIVALLLEAGIGTDIEEGAEEAVRLLTP